MFPSAHQLDSGPLSGRHVRLEPLSLQHLDGLVAAANGPRETFTYVTVPEDAAAMRQQVEVALALAHAGAAVPFATIDLRDGSVAGMTRFAQLEHCQLPCAGLPLVQPSEVEIGWTWLAARAQRTAINTEAKLLMLTHAFEVWRVRRVVLKTAEKNARSRAAIERLGAALDGLTTTWSPDHKPRMTAWFSMPESSWPVHKARLQARLGG